MKAIPATNNEQILKYNTCFYECQCADFASRGGSYRDPINNDRVCKHISHYRANARYAAEHNAMMEAQSIEAQAAKAKQAIDNLYGKVAPSQSHQPTESLLDWTRFLEFDAPTHTAPVRKVDNPAYAEWLFAHFDDEGVQGQEPEKYIFI